MKKTIPAVSIIIPMYNAEKYIGECLDSILAQTFQDFEVIVVDDCSTDNSCAIVESYLPKFNQYMWATDKLQLIRSDKNSGSPGIPRNLGIILSRGEYIMFVDADDAITSTATEELYSIAKKLDVDVVHAEKCYQFSGDRLTTNKNYLEEKAIIPVDFVDKPTFMPENPIERLQILEAHKFDWSTCHNFVRRDFILKYGIKFPNNRVQEDTIFAIYLLCLAKKIVRVPNIFYIYRYRQDSICRPESSPPEKRISKWGNAMFKSIPLFDKFMDTHDLFNGHPDYKYALFDFLVKYIADPACNLYSHFPAYQIDELIRKELNEVEDKTALTAFFFARMNVLNMQLNRQNAIIQQMQAYIQQQNQVIRQLQNK